jgi:spermidine/putrescine-binding protein
MLFIKRMILTSCILAFQIKAQASFKPTINVLTMMHTLDPALVANFENENKTNVRVDFVGSRSEFESHIKSGLRTYDIIIADERILEKLFLNRLLRSLPDEDIPKIDNKYPLYKRSKINEDGAAYLPLFVNPLGIAYNQAHSTITYPVSWDILIRPDKNPYWRQRIFVSPSYKSQFLLALLATQKEITASSWFIPEATTKWFKQLKLENANTDLPLELAFLGDKISAAVIFYSYYLRIKKVVPGLDYTIPTQSTYYDRVSVGWASSSAQEVLAKKLIQFLYSNRENLAKNLNMLSLNTLNFKRSDTHAWVLYEDDIPLPKKIENILKDLAQAPNSPTL